MSAFIMEEKDNENGSSCVEVGDSLKELTRTLEQHKSWDGRQLVKYDGFWCVEMALKPILSSQKNFKAKSNDIILASFPKSGTTWMKSLIFSIVNRNLYTIDQSPLLTSNPHVLVPFLEFDLYWNQENPDLDSIPSPRFFATHVPFNLLPNSILENSECKIIHICRNPFDQFVSLHHFVPENEISDDDAPLKKSFDMFCDGILHCGPFWDYNLGYWNAHLKNPEKILFLKYEDLKEDTTPYVKKIAEFIGLPFSMEEEEHGLMEQIVRLCSFENLSNLEINKTGYIENWGRKNSSYFRKGKVGDWTNHLTPAMVERLKNVMESKLGGSGLTFKTHNDCVK